MATAKVFSFSLIEVLSQKKNKVKTLFLSIKRGWGKGEILQTSSDIFNKPHSKLKIIIGNVQVVENYYITTS